MTPILMVFILIEVSFSDYIMVLNPEKPYEKIQFSITKATISDDIVYRWAAWFKYLPLTSIVQIPTIGLFDSDCYHLLSFIELESNSLNFLHFDCLDLQKLTITKFITFIGNDDLQYQFVYNIDVFGYENQWYYFDLIIYPSFRKFEYIIIRDEEILYEQQLNIFPFKDENFIVTTGASLIVENSQIISITQGTKFSSFPGKLIIIQCNDSIKNFALSAIQLAYFVKICNCQINPIINLEDSEFIKLDTLIHTSKYYNCDSFIFSGWFKINEIIQNSEEMSYQFIKLTSNIQNQQLTNENLAPFQLFYKFSKEDQRIIITTYSYFFPSVTMDFTKQSFLITKEFIIESNISLWHLIYVKQLDNRLEINIKFYDKKQVYEYSTEIIVNHFHQIYFKLFLGNYMQSTFDYLNILGRNLVFINCNSDFQQQNCHHSCGECDGPTNRDCLSCTLDSLRIYHANSKQCICPYYTIDDYDCKYYKDFQLNLIQDVVQNQECKYGQYELDNVCYQCPSIQNEQKVTCLECLQNPKEWIQNPFCETFLYLNQDGSTSNLNQTSKFERQYFIFNGVELELCLECQQASILDQINIDQDFQFKSQKFQSFCYGGKELCYQCSIPYCKYCQMLITGQTCLQCNYWSTLQNGQCTQIFYGYIQENKCISPYYINSMKQCKRCPINHCIYCFEYVRDDLTKSTLYKDFQIFNGDENLSIGCALCEDGFTFDFQVGLCMERTSQINSCLRSYINQEGNEICTLSQQQDFAVAREIINCEQLISNCLQCFLTLQQILRCIICKEGYTSSIIEVNGQCYPNKNQYAIISIEGDTFQKDGWVQRIQSFMGQFLPQQYFYPQSQFLQYYGEIAITCKEGYHLIKQKDCIKYCDADCLECLLNSVSTSFICSQCPLDYFQTSQRVQINGTCQQCSPLCIFCNQRNIDEIFQVQEIFISTKYNELFSKQCIQSRQDSKIMIQPKILIPSYCLDQYCQNNLLYEVIDYDYNIVHILENYFQNEILLKYLNQIGVKTISIQLKYTPNIYSGYGLQIDSLALKQNIFSLQKTNLTILGNGNVFKDNIDFEYFLENFDIINIYNCTFQLSNSTLNLYSNTKVKLLIENVQFKGEQYQIQSLINITISQSIQMVDIQLLDLFFQQSSFLNLDAQLFGGNIYISSFRIFNSTIYNSSLFILLNNEFSIYVDNFIIENCTLINSSIFQMQQNLIDKNLISMENIIIKNCKLINSIIINNIDFVKLAISNLQIHQNTFQNSNFLVFNFNVSLFKVNIEDNLLDTSRLIKTHEIRTLNYFIFSVDQLVIKNTVLKYSNILYLLSNSFQNNLIVQLINLHFYNNERQDNLQQQYYLIAIINCYDCSIQKGQLINSKNLPIFYFFQSNNILIENIKYEQLLETQKIHYSLNCQQLKQQNQQLFYISGFILLKLQQIEIYKNQNVDQTLIEIISSVQYLADIQEQIELSHILFKENILLKAELKSTFSLITIYSEKRQLIFLNNITFVNNIFHQYEDAPFENSASLLYIDSGQGILQINQLNCLENALTNSSSSFMFINSLQTRINNLTVNSHNIINQLFWSQFYSLNLNQQFNQEQIKEIIHQLYHIKVKGGVAKITSEKFVCENSKFQDILALTNSIFDIKTEGLGVVRLYNISSNQILSIQQDPIDNSGCLKLNSQNSYLDFEMMNSTFVKVINQMSTSILTINPSQRKTIVLLENIQFINCISLLNQVMKVQFQSNQNSNFLKIINVTVILEESAWINYFLKYGQLNQVESALVLNDNAIFNFVGGRIKVNLFIIDGIIASPIFQIQNPLQVKINNCYIHGLKSFYPLQLIVIDQQSESEVNLQNIQINGFQIYKHLLVQYQDLILNEYEAIGCQIFEKTSTRSQSYIIESNIQLLQQQQKNTNLSLIKLSSSNQYAKILLQNTKVTLNYCQFCSQGILYFDINNFLYLRISELVCYQNQAQQDGCLFLRSNSHKINEKVVIQQSNFIYNNGSQGSAIKIENLFTQINMCKFLKNYASKYGGGIYFNIEINKFKIIESIFIGNRAGIAGGIFFENPNNLNYQNFIQTFFLFNQAEIYANNLVETPTHLSVSINQITILTQKFLLDNITILTPSFQPYLIIEQGNLQFTKYLMIPSNYQINNYKIYNPNIRIYKSYLTEILVQYKNKFDERLEDFINSTCQVDTNIVNQDYSATSEKNLRQNIIFDSVSKGFDLSSLSFTLDPYFQSDKMLQISLNCQSQVSDQTLSYYIYAKTLKCQLGEFYVERGCQTCQSSQGFYSVTYNTTKCSIFDKEKFINITSNQINLQQGFWRPNYLSDQTEYCFKNPKFCTGGWQVGDNLCGLGHLGGLCEECDIYDIKGKGQFYKNLQDFECLKCNSFVSSILPFALSSLWALISILITLRSIEKSNRLFSSLKIRQKFSKIIFKLDQDHESILIKMLLNYLWLFSIIFSFNIKFSFSFSFFEQTSNTLYFMANNLDCYLSVIQEVSLIYLRIVTMLTLIVAQLLLIQGGFVIYSYYKNINFNQSIISNTLLYLYVSNYAALIKQFCSIISKREISSIPYIQGDVSLMYGTENHISWIISFAIPGLGIIGILIPFSLFFLMYLKKDQLDKIKLRRHICYLYNEYNSESYYWEQIKLSKKTIIIVILTYFENNVLLKASLLGLCLLFYQLLAVNQKPYIISSLNFLDIQTGQICSVTIFLAAVKYVCEQENEQTLSILLQMMIVLLSIRLCYPFIVNIVRVYFKKYTIPCISKIYKFLRFIKINCLANYMNEKLKTLNKREQLKKNYFAKLRSHLISISKVQIGQQKQILSLINSQSTLRYRQTITNLDMNKLLNF